MRWPNLLITFCTLTPVSLALPQAAVSNAASCSIETLAPATWTSLNLDTFLSSWAAANVTPTASNDVQALAASFGAPNFFCGLGDYCNADQPCEPVQLPEWYILLAIQNWNSYMNSINTGITFASAIAGLSLPGIVSDFYPNPVDNVTPLENIAKIFTTILGIIPFTGALKTASSVITGGVSFLTSQIKAPTEPNLFVKWSDISSSLSQVLQDYQSAVSTFIQTTINAPVNSSTGIDSLLTGGTFLGTSENFTQADLESQVASAINVFAAGLTLQAQETFIWVLNVSQSAYTEITSDNGPLCDNINDSASICGSSSNGGLPGAAYRMIQLDSNGNVNDQTAAASLLTGKYGLTLEQVLIGPTNCYLNNGNKQLASPFTNSLPLDATTACLFNLKVCIWDDATYISVNTNPSSQDVVQVCQGLGIGF